MDDPGRIDELGFKADGTRAGGDETAGCLQPALLRVLAAVSKHEGYVWQPVKLILQGGAGHAVEETQQLFFTEGEIGIYVVNSCEAGQGIGNAAADEVADLVGNGTHDACDGAAECGIADIRLGVF